jgi:hypothetical protein
MTKSTLVTLLKGLQALEIHSTATKPELEDWLDILNDMFQLKTLSLHYATPVAPPAPLIYHSLRVPLHFTPSANFMSPLLRKVARWPSLIS